MEQKLLVEDEQKIISLKNYLDKISSFQIYDQDMERKRDELASVLKHLLTPLGMVIVNLKRSETKINEEFQHELTHDLIESDPLFKDVEFYLSHSRDLFAQQEKIIQILSSFIVEFLTISNVKTPISPAPDSSIDDGTPALSQEEREKLKRIAHTLILSYKEQKSTAKKNTVASRLLHYADTKEKYRIINDIFLDLVGEKVLDKLKKKKFRPKEDAE